MENQTNPELELAYRYVRDTDINIFLTGKAGTGKTTFLQRIKREIPKQMAVVAPTGVAAINAGGVTIHSLFQMPFGAYIPGAKVDPSKQRRFSSKKIDLIRSLDLLVIDEISMVRADLLDSIDDVLRRYRNFRKPFGGLQLLMIGDLHQLPPVVKDHEWYTLREHYNTPYFFGSQALAKTPRVSIELKKIYRQSDSIFIDLLNKVRNNRIDEQVLETLNSRYRPDFQATEEDGYITLSSHNATADKINLENLEKQPGKEYTFTATVTGDFAPNNYPNDEKIVLKIGAQVMFVKNDVGQDRRYYNGKIGKVTAIVGKEVTVLCPGDKEPITTSNVEWENIKYDLDKSTKEVKEEVVGSFQQLPLKLAWAITIHKSQGLTFERAIIDANAAFTHGQVYVALSRCKTFEGIVLRTKIANSSIKTDTTVQGFSADVEKNMPTESDLQISQRAYQSDILLELFAFQDLNYRYERLHRLLAENHAKIVGSTIEKADQVGEVLDNGLINVSRNFQPSLRAYVGQEPLPEENEELQARLQKAAVYFYDKLETGVEEILDTLYFETDNQVLEVDLKKALLELKRVIAIKKACFGVCKERFTTLAYLRARSKAQVDFDNPGSARTSKKALEKTVAKADVVNPVLFENLKKWRKEKAAHWEAPVFTIFHTTTLAALAAQAPTTSKAFLTIKGIGKTSLEKHGPELLEIIEDYLAGRPAPAYYYEPPVKEVGAPEPEPEPEVINTRDMTLAMFLAGKTIEEIAEEREFVVGTIESHLVHFIKAGSLAVTKVIEPEIVDEIELYLRKHPDETLTEIRLGLEEKYSYNQLRMVRSAMEAETKED